jgi:hypothetical protein
MCISLEVYTDNHFELKVMRPVPILLDDHRHQVCEVSTHSFNIFGDTNLHAKT